MDSPAVVRELAVESAYWLFSQRKMIGSAHTAARFSASWTTPWLAPPSPKQAMTTLSAFLSFDARAAPVTGPGWKSSSVFSSRGRILTSVVERPSGCSPLIVSVRLRNGPPIGYECLDHGSAVRVKRAHPRARGLTPQDPPC